MNRFWSFDFFCVKRPGLKKKKKIHGSVWSGQSHFPWISTHPESRPGANTASGNLRGGGGGLALLLLQPSAGRRHCWSGSAPRSPHPSLERGARSRWVLPCPKTRRRTGHRVTFGASDQLGLGVSFALWFEVLDYRYFDLRILLAFCLWNVSMESEIQGLHV